ncbi:MAG: sulfatase [Patescibacteria group bacterium]
MGHNKPNIIYITFDSVRTSHLSFNGYKKNTTPFIDSLIRKGIYFKNAFATGPGSSVSFVGIFTSTYPLDYGGYSYIKKPRVLFPEALKEAGYTTIGVHSSPYLSDYFGYNRGWDQFLYLNHFKKYSGVSMSPGFQKGTLKSKTLKKATASHQWLKNKIPPLAAIFKIIEKSLLLFRKIIKDIFKFKPAFFTGEEMNREVERILDGAQNRPVFLWIHYLDAHAPYGLFEKNGHGLIKKIKYHISDIAAFLFGEVNFINKLFLPIHKSLYDESLKYLDGNIKNLFRFLENRGILNQNSVIIMNSDHGEEFLEHESFGHPQKLFNVNIKIPLIFYSPGKKFGEPRIVSNPVSLIDLGPTILKIAGIHQPDSYKGNDIFDRKNKEVVVQASESSGDLTNPDWTGIAIIHNNYKLIHWKKQKLLFSLDDVEEKNNLYEIKKDIVKNLEEIKEKYSIGQYQEKL